MISLKGMEILFADDDKYNMRPVIDALEAHSANVILVTNGTSVLRYMRDNLDSPPHIIILDIMMAGGKDINTDDGGRSTGVEVYRILRRDMKLNIPIVISTVVSDPAILSVFHSDPRVSIVSKPYLLSELLDAISRIVSNR